MYRGTSRIWPPACRLPACPHVLECCYSCRPSSDASRSNQANGLGSFQSPQALRHPNIGQRATPLPSHPTTFLTPSSYGETISQSRSSQARRHMQLFPSSVCIYLHLSSSTPSLYTLQIASSIIATWRRIYAVQHLTQQTHGSLAQILFCARQDGPSGSSSPPRDWWRCWTTYTPPQLRQPQLLINRTHQQQQDLQF